MNYNVICNEIMHLLIVNHYIIYMVFTMGVNAIYCY